MIRPLVFTAATLLACYASAAAQTIPAMQASMRDGERAVTTYFTEDSVGDVQLGKLGLAKSRNAAVRTLAQALVNDHTMTARVGLRVAKATGNDEVQFKPGDDNVITLVHLSRYSGTQFDNEYVKALVDAHKTDIQTATDSLAFVSNAQIRSYLQTTLRVDRKHLAMAQAIEAKQ